MAVDERDQGNVWNPTRALGYTYQRRPSRAPAEMSASKWSRSARFQKPWRKCGWGAASLNLPKRPRNWNQKKTKVTWAGFANWGQWTQTYLWPGSQVPALCRMWTDHRLNQLSTWLQMWPWLPGLGTDASDSRQGQLGCKLSSPLKSTWSDTPTASSSGHQSELWRSPPRIASIPTPHCLNPCISGCQGHHQGSPTGFTEWGAPGRPRLYYVHVILQIPKRCIL